MSGEQGSATVLVLAVMLVVLAAGVVATAVAETVDARHHAAVAADAAALAAAARLIDGQAAACSAAARVARADGVTLQTCEIAGAEAIVTVTAATRIPWIRGEGLVRLNARAGPVETNRDKATPVVRPT